MRRNGSLIKKKNTSSFNYLPMIKPTFAMKKIGTKTIYIKRSSIPYVCGAQFQLTFIVYLTTEIGRLVGENSCMSVKVVTV